MIFTKKSKISRDYKGFTLAEVLITILIIGTVFALTINNLIIFKDKKIAETGAKEAYSILNSAILRMQNDGIIASDYTCKPASEFKEKFFPYFGIIKDCGSRGGCVPYTNSSKVYSSLSGEPGRADYFGYNQFVIKNGFFIGMNTCEAVGSGKYEIWIAVDINGYKTKPNIFAKDTFFFILRSGNKLIPNGMKTTWGATSSGCDKNIIVGHEGIGCTSRILQGDTSYW